MMIDGPPIARGYPYRLRLTLVDEEAAPVALFPSGAVLRAQVRTQRAAATVAGTLTTGNGALVRIADNVLDFIIPETVTAALAAGGFAHVDVARSDTAPNEFTGLYLRIPVIQPVTVPA